METGYNRLFAHLVNSATGGSLFVALGHGLTGSPPGGFEPFPKAWPRVGHADVDTLVMHKGVRKGFTRNGMANQAETIGQARPDGDRGCPAVGS